MKRCLSCKVEILNRNGKYCSNKCQADFQYMSYIDTWKNGKASGNRGINAINISRQLRRYLLEKYNHACSICNWGEINPTTGKSPLEVDHIDGNSDNNSESNLRLLCPNCHSLTVNYKNLNNGNGRQWRKTKYIKSVVS